MFDTTNGTVIVIFNDKVGWGDKDLGRQWMARFVQQLQTQSPEPHAMLFCSAWVKLLVNASHCLDGLRSLERDGTGLLACGTCVDHCQLRNHLAAGHGTEMREIVATINAAPTVVTIWEESCGPSSCCCASS